MNPRWDNPKLEILAQTPDWVAVVKPAGLATIPGRGEIDSVLERLAAQLDLPHSGSDDPRIRVVHRLDKDTSGVLVFAKNSATQRHFSHQFQNNTAQKEYIALVVGRPQQSEGDIEAPIARHPTDPKRMTVVKRGGRPARTLWKVEETFRGFSLLRLFPRTGKTHQIRVHLLHIGLPLAIDPLYNPSRAGASTGLFLSTLKRDYRPTRGERERPLIARLPLHAHRLALVDPSGQPIALEAHIPKDLRAALNQLSRAR